MMGLSIAHFDFDQLKNWKPNQINWNPILNQYWPNKKMYNYCVFFLKNCRQMSSRNFAIRSQLSIPSISIFDCEKILRIIFVTLSTIFVFQSFWIGIHFSSCAVKFEDFFLSQEHFREAILFLFPLSKTPPISSRSSPGNRYQRMCFSLTHLRANVAWDPYRGDFHLNSIFYLL